MLLLMLLLKRLHKQLQERLHKPKQTQLLDPLGIDVVIDVETPSGRQNVVESMKKRKTEKPGEKQGKSTGKVQEESKTGTRDNSMETDSEVVEVTEKVAEMTTKDSETGQESSTIAGSVATAAVAAALLPTATAVPSTAAEPNDDEDAMMASRVGDDDWQMIGASASASASAPAAAVAVAPAAAEGAVPKRKSPSPERHVERPNIPEHVAKSLEQMMAMGFSNDGNWLEQLLLAKDGNITMALDAINPNKPPSGHQHHL